MEENTIDIAGHMILITEIIGLSPLYRKRKPAGSMEDALYSLTQHCFKVHCRQSSIDIESDWFYMKGIQDKEREACGDLAAKKWIGQYYKAKDELKELFKAATA